MIHDPSKPSFLMQCKISIRSMHALGLRNIISRYGRQNLGFVWVFIEPALLCIGVMLLWRLMKGSSEHGLSLVAMVFSGYMPLTLWRHLSNGGVFVYRGAKSIVIHKNITLIDVWLSRSLFEIISTTMAALFLYVVLVEFNIIFPAYDFGDILVGWLVMASLGLGLSLVTAAACEENEVVVHFIQPLQYISLPLSGSFFLVEWLPSKYQDYIVYVPMVHSYETIRKGLFGPAVTTHDDAMYAFSWSIVMLAVGFIWLKRIRDRIEA